MLTRRELLQRVGTGLGTVGLAAVLAQLTESARTANGIGVTIMAAGYALRAAGDSGAATWLGWLSPFGWSQQVRPFADQRPWVLLVLFGTAIAGLVLAYLVSGGLLGLGLTFTGGFLYFGAWLARLAADAKESQRRLADTLLVLADVTSRAAHTRDDGVDVSALPVTAGDGTTMHRRDCALIAHRDDLHPVGESNGHLTPCRVCRP